MKRSCATKKQRKTNDEMLLELLPVARYRCLTDLYYLAKEILGYKDLVPEVHGPLCNLIQSNNPLVYALAGKNCTLYDMPLAKDLYAKYKLPHKHAESGNPSPLGLNKVCDIRANSGKVPSGGTGVGGKVNTHLLNSAENSENLTSTLKRIEALVLTELEQADWGRIGGYKRLGGLREKLYMVHRGGFKTTLISIAHTIQLMLLWPDIRILITSHSFDRGSRQILEPIRQLFMGNNVLRSLFAEWVPNENTVGKIEWGTQNSCLLPNRSSGCVYPENTVEVAGSTTNVTGRHYDYVKNDDLVTADSVTNEAQIEKTRAFKNLQTYLFNQPEWGMTDNIGTIYHFNDLWCELEKTDITVVKIPIYDDNENIIFKERFSMDGIKAIRDGANGGGGIGSYEFHCQYLLNPVPPASQTFKPEWLERLGFTYEQVEIEGVPMRVRAYFDPASKKRKKSDYTAWIVIGVDDKGTKYLLDIGRDKLEPEARTNKVFDVCQKWGLHEVYYETIGFQDTDKYIIDRKCRERRYYINVKEIKASHTSKEDRIRGLQPLYERGDIRWPRSIIYYSEYEKKNINMLQALKDEMFMFPKCIHDDMLDVHSFMLRVDEYNASKRIVVKEEDKLEQIRLHYIKEKRALLALRASSKPSGNPFRRGTSRIFKKKQSHTINAKLSVLGVIK